MRERSRAKSRIIQEGEYYPEFAGVANQSARKTLSTGLGHNEEFGRNLKSRKQSYLVRKMNEAKRKGQKALIVAKTIIVKISISPH